MDWFIENLLTPIALATVPVLAGLILKLANKFVDFLMSKMSKESTQVVVSNALTQLDLIIESVVAANDVLTQEYKAAHEDGKLTDEEKEHLRTIARDRIITILPATVTGDDVLKLLGGKENLIKLINDGIEKALTFIRK